MCVSNVTLVIGEDVILCLVQLSTPILCWVLNVRAMILLLSSWLSIDIYPPLF